MKGHSIAITVITKTLPLQPWCCTCSSNTGQARPVEPRLKQTYGRGTMAHQRDTRRQMFNHFKMIQQKWNLSGKEPIRDAFHMWYVWSFRHCVFHFLAASATSARDTLAHHGQPQLPVSAAGLTFWVKGEMQTRSKESETHGSGLKKNRKTHTSLAKTHKEQVKWARFLSWLDPIQAWKQACKEAWRQHLE